ncbi:MAG: riboflavin biosynthesis protein RibF, partial [Gaiellaceae bacterium]
FHDELRVQLMEEHITTIEKSMNEIIALGKAEPVTVAVGTFDGVHRGHHAVLEAAIATGLAPTAVTFDPHPRIALGNRVELLTTLERRLELFEEAGVETTLVAAFTPELQKMPPEQFVEHVLRSIGAEVVVAGSDFRFGVKRSGDLELLERLGLEIVVPSEVEGVSSTAIRAALRDGDVVSAARMLGRPFELDGTVVAGDQRGGTLGYPTANLLLEPDLACPRYGIYAGAARGHRAAVSIGTNPHYGGVERRIEPYLLDFEGDLYGERLVVEIWERLRDEAAFESEEALVAQIARDVEATRRARRPGDDR